MDSKMSTAEKTAAIDMAMAVAETFAESRKKCGGIAASNEAIHDIVQDLKDGEKVNVELLKTMKQILQVLETQTVVQNVTKEKISNIELRQAYKTNEWNSKTRYIHEFIQGNGTFLAPEWLEHQYDIGITLEDPSSVTYGSYWHKSDYRRSAIKFVYF